jgi:hypothetical protein
LINCLNHPLQPSLGESIVCNLYPW